MPDCPLYFEFHRTLRSRELRADRQASVQRVAVPCCDHKCSPAPRHIAPNVIGGAHLLTCGGDLTKCQIPAEQR